jgi:hypothetical protein
MMNWMTHPVPRAATLAPLPAALPPARSAACRPEPMVSRPMSPAARLIAQPPVDWSRFRAPPREQDRKLSKAAQDWLRGLPGARWPMNLATHYPRIVNHLALVWPDRHLTDMGFERLLTDTRGGRAGFPGPVQADLLALRRLRREMTDREQSRFGWDLTLMATSDR